MRRKRKRKCAPASVSILDLADAHLKERSVASAKKPVVGTGNFKKKIVSESLAVCPNQVKDMMEKNKKLGVSVEYDGHGRPIFDNSAHFRRFAKAHGFRHKQY